jgi:type II secretory pathway pseudopilin PulG
MTSTVQAMPKPDRFWRRFAVVMACVVLIPIAIAILGILAAMAIPAFVKGRQHAQAIHQQIEKQKQQLAEQNAPIRSDYIGKTWFPRGDSIEILSVERSQERMAVKGRYNLASADSAELTLNITSTNLTNVPQDPAQSLHISKGWGDFELSRSHLVPGLPHVSMYANGGSFAGVYFGTKDEALKESKLDLGEPLASAETWSPTFAPGEKPDLQKILDEAKDLMSKGQYEESLQRHIWHFNHASEFGDSYQSIVRLTSGVPDWEELGRRYPKAKQALIEIRDNKTRELAEGRGYTEMLQDVQAINHELQNDDATYALFKAIEEKDPKLARRPISIWKICSCRRVTMSYA